MTKPIQKKDKPTQISDTIRKFREITEKYKNPVLEPHLVERRKFCSACGEEVWDLKEHLKECKPDIIALEGEIEQFIISEMKEILAGLKGEIAEQKEMKKIKNRDVYHLLEGYNKREQELREQIERIIEELSSKARFYGSGNKYAYN